MTRFLKPVWIINERFLKPVWIISKRLLRPVWIINRRSMRPVWIISAMIAVLILVGVVVSIVGFTPKVFNMML